MSEVTQQQRCAQGFRPAAVLSGRAVGEMGTEGWVSLSSLGAKGTCGGIAWWLSPPCPAALCTWHWLHIVILACPRVSAGATLPLSMVQPGHGEGCQSGSAVAWPAGQGDSAGSFVVTQVLAEAWTMPCSPFALLSCGLAVGDSFPTANQGTVLLPPLADRGCENAAGIRVGHASVLTLPGLESALLCLEFVGSAAVTVMEGCAWLSSVDMELGRVGRQNQAWDKMHLSTDVLCPLEAELRGGTGTQHCLPTGRCAKHSLVPYSAPIINQCAACCTDSPEVNSQTPEAETSLPAILFGHCVVGGRWDSGDSQQWHIWLTSGC